MTKEQARRVLLAYRPESSDRQDPEVGQALELAQEDPALQSWLEEQQAFHRAVRAQLRSVAPPAGLKEQILARPKIIVPIWRRAEFLLAAAACLGLGLILAALWGPGAPKEETFAGFRSRMVGFALRVYGMDIVTNDLTQVRQYLSSHGAPADYALTPGLQQVPVKGGGVIPWQGHPVGMVCFSLASKKTLFMFVLDQRALRDGGVPSAHPVITSKNGFSTASWSREGRVYFLAAEADPGVLKSLVSL